MYSECALTEKVLLAGPASEILIVWFRLFTTVTNDSDGVSVGGTAVGSGVSVGKGMAVGTSVGGGKGVLVGGGGCVGVSVGGTAVGSGVLVGGKVGVTCCSTNEPSLQDTSVKQTSPIKTNQTVRREDDFMVYSLPDIKLGSLLEGCDSMYAVKV